MAAMIFSLRMYCTMALVALLHSYAAAAQHSPIDPVMPAAATATVRAEPRPIGVPDEATPEERGREVLRVIVELIKRRDIRDTEFASRLLRLPIEKGKGFALSTPERFPQQLVSSIGYSSSDVVLSIDIGLESSRTCVSVADLLEVFHRELGVGRKLIDDRQFGKSVQVPLSEGWYVYRGHTDILDQTRMYRPLGNAWRAAFSIRDNAQCILQFVVDDFNTNPKG